MDLDELTDHAVIDQKGGSSCEPPNPPPPPPEGPVAQGSSGVCEPP
jgi:hypothetical protein